MAFYLGFLKYTLMVTLAILLSLFSLSTVAELRVQLAEGSQLLAINGEALTKPLHHRSKPLVLDNGTHQLLVQHTAEIETSDGEEIYEKSDTFVIVFDAHNTDLRLAVPPIKSVSAFNRFNRSAQWRLTDSNNQAVTYKISRLVKDGIQFGRNYTEELRQFNQTEQPASLASLVVKLKAQFPKTQSPKTQPRASIAAISPTTKQVKPSVAKTEKPAIPATQATGISYRTLIELYQQATPEVQEQFFQWLRTQQ